MKKDVRLVLCDIDSTLTTSDHVLTDKTKQIINELHNRGIYFGIASGRPLDEIAKKSNLWGFDYDFDILIGMNGSELWDNIQQKEFGYYKLKPNWIKEILDLMSRFEANYFIYKNGYLLSKRIDEMMLRSAKSSNKEIVTVKDNREFYAEENAKIMFRVKEEIMPEIELFLENHESKYYKGFKTQTTLMEFADRRISKAYALQQFCTMNNISLDEVISFGDTTNDNEMLKVSGLGVCMMNGSDDTKAIADVITEKSNDEDGFADYIEKYVL